MWIPIILFLLLALAAGLYYVMKHTPSTSSSGQCVFVTPKGGNDYTCNCSKGMTQTVCTAKNGIYDASSGCSGDFQSICSSQLIGSCKTSSSCTYPSTRGDCSGGTFTVGVKTCF